MSSRILVVDDSETVRHMIRTLLSKEGYHVIEADNGETGVRMARDDEIDLIIVDLNMPKMNGIDMIKEVRSFAKHERTPIFMLTTEKSHETSSEGRKAGATAWMIKPFKPDQLLNGVRMVLAARQTRL